MLITYRKPIIITNTFAVYFNQIGPYEKYQDNPVVTFKEESTYQEDLFVYEIFRFAEGDETNQRTVTKPYHAIEPDSTYTGTFTIPTSLLLGDKGMNITIDIYDYQANYKIYTNTVTIYPIGNTIINPTKMDEFIAPHNIVKISNKTVKYTEERFTFTKMSDYFLTDLYYRMPINQFEFTSSIKSDDFAPESAYLIIRRMKKYFPSLPHIKNTATIALSTVYGESAITLQFKNQLYVEPKILQMGVAPQTGYVQTKNFYFPVNHLEDLYGSSFDFQINGIGINKTCLRWSTSLLSNSGLIGKCHNSGYCVTGKVTE